MIIDSARALDREGLTVQAVADRLGVDRKAISRHVAGRRHLVDLVAAQTISEGLGGSEVARFLGELPDDRLPHLRRLPFTRDPHQNAEDQARFGIDLVVTGLRHHLAMRPA